MKLSISNIAWKKEQDEDVYRLMKHYGFTGLEIAPSRLVETDPYTHVAHAAEIVRDLKERFGFEVPSMQSILFGRTEAIFRSASERKAAARYLHEAISYAGSLGISNMVFGSPKNRIVYDEDWLPVFDFFEEIGDRACENDTVIALEPNPAIYGTNFLNTTMETVDFIRELDHPGVRLNLDTGAMIANGESLQSLESSLQFVNHVHISEPWLVPLEKRDLYSLLMKRLQQLEYDRFVSVEMNLVDPPGGLIVDILAYMEMLNREASFKAGT